eukprot:m.116695 g.116695  ORF g.116695 m.116695 type:complete len:753 (+) comp9508_c1_seq1:1232-3490(+)
MRLQQALALAALVLPALVAGLQCGEFECGTGTFCCSVVSGDSTVLACCSVPALDGSEEPDLTVRDGNLVLRVPAERTICFQSGTSTPVCTTDLASVAVAKDTVRDMIGPEGLDFDQRIEAAELLASVVQSNFSDYRDTHTMTDSEIDAAISSAVSSFADSSALTSLESRVTRNEEDIAGIVSALASAANATDLQAVLDHLNEHKQNTSTIRDALVEMIESEASRAQAAEQSNAGEISALKTRVSKLEDCNDQGLIYDKSSDSCTTLSATVPEHTDQACTSANKGMLAYFAELESVMICTGTAWVHVSSQPYGSTSLNPGRDCLDILKASSVAPLSGLYFIQPVESKPPFRVYCDMTTDGGGWTMCYSTSDVVHLKTETTYDAANPFGTNGYRSNCQDLPFNEVQYYSHASNQAALFKRQEPATVKMSDTDYYTTGAAFGSWKVSGDISSSYIFQMGICDHDSSLGTGLWFSGINDGCYKQCNGWCSDYSSPYFRADSEEDCHNGVAFNENGHGCHDLGAKLISVGVRNTFNPDLLGASASNPGKDCKDIKTKNPVAVDGPYYIRPDGVSNAFLAHCDMTTNGGGWTMCYTSNHVVHLASDIDYILPFPVNGYHTDCRDVTFNQVLYINEDNGQKEWFLQRQGTVFKASSTDYFTTGSAFGLWDPQGGVASTSYAYQMGICDHGESLAPGIWMSGYTNSCWKQCHSWCGDTTSPYFRLDSELDCYNGVAFNINGHQGCETDLPATRMSVGVRT